jgi:hypothetical protein
MCPVLRTRVKGKVKTCKSSRPSHPVLLLVFRQSGESSQEKILWPQENKTEINASLRISGERTSDSSSEPTGIGVQSSNSDSGSC